MVFYYFETNYDYNPRVEIQNSTRQENISKKIAKVITLNPIVGYNNAMNELMKRIADHLGLNPILVRYEDITDDSRMYFEKGYICIS